MMQYHFPARCCGAVDIRCQHLSFVSLDWVNKGNIFTHLMHSQTRLDKITCLSQVKPQLNVRLENQLPAVRNRVKALNPVIHGMDTRTVVCVPNCHHGTQVSLFKGVVESGFGFYCAIEQTPLPNVETVSFPSFSHSARCNYLTR